LNCEILTNLARHVWTQRNVVAWGVVANPGRRLLAATPMSPLPLIVSVQVTQVG
jgi:hypothetical protein